MAKKPVEPEIPIEELQEAIIKLSKGMAKLRSSRLRPQTICLLVSRSSGVGMGDTKKVLDALESLELHYLRPPNKATKKRKTR